MKTHKTLFNACMLAVTAALCTPASAEGVRPLTDILNTLGSAGLGVAIRAATSPYSGGGTRYDMVPLYLYEGDRLFLHANRAGVKLFNDGDRSVGQRFDRFVEQRFKGFPAENLPASLAGITPLESGIDLVLAVPPAPKLGHVACTANTRCGQRITRLRSAAGLRLRMALRALVAAA